MKSFEKGFKYWWYSTLFKLIGVDSGPMMIRYRGDWLFIDDYRCIYRIKYTAQHGNPLVIIRELDLS